MRQVILYFSEEGNWVADCPSLLIASQGKTKEEALINIKEAIDLWIEDAIEHHEQIPEDVPPIELAQV